MRKVFKKDQTQKPLYDRLIWYGHESGVVPFDVPGHKMGKGIHPQFVKDVGEKIFQIDINSSKPVDMLSAPKGVIKEAEELAADAYGSDHAYFLVNGSTSGVQNMILATVGPGDKIIMPRNVHKSAINALILSGATPVFMEPYVSPDLGIAMGVPFEEAKKVMDRNKEALAIMLVNPTYFGMTQDLKRIMKYAHGLGMMVLVDESHGAHFAFSDKLPASASVLGADFTTISMHKTGGSLTQSSMLLMNSQKMDKYTVRSTINLMQSSSANFLLMASLDIARQYLATEGEELISKAISLAKYARKEISGINGITCIGEERLNGDSIKSMDLMKLVIDVADLGLTGFEVYDMLYDEFNIRVELGETNVILALVSFADTKESVQILIDALRSIAEKYRKNKQRLEVKVPSEIPELVITPRDAYYHKKEVRSLRESEGLISGESLMIYPPGIPLIIPGERITKSLIDYYYFLIEEGCLTIGSSSEQNDVLIEVLV